MFGAIEVRVTRIDEGYGYHKGVPSTGSKPGTESTSGTESTPDYLDEEYCSL